MRRSLKSELMRIATVLALPIAIGVVFPLDALSFRATNDRPVSKAFVSIVRLDDETERAAIRTAKSSLRGEGSRSQRLHADLSFGELPEEPLRPVLEKPGELSSPEPSAVRFGIPVYRPSAAAKMPSSIPAFQKSQNVPAFSREELLKID